MPRPNALGAFVFQVRLEHEGSSPEVEPTPANTSLRGQFFRGEAQAGAVEGQRSVHVRYPEEGDDLTDIGRRCHVGAVDLICLRGSKLTYHTRVMDHFSELNLCTALRTNLSKNNFVIPTPVQAQAIPPLMEGRDVVATAQTGTGKTLAFAIPIIEALMAMPRSKSVKALILSPTRELAIQIEEAIAELLPGTRIKTAVVVGGMSEAKQLKDIEQGAEIIIATPGRLCDYIDRRLVKLGETAMIVLDEADRMLDMGFLPALQMILNKLFTKRQTMLFSATIETSVAHLVHQYVNDHVRVEIGASTRPAEQVDLYCFEIEERSKFDLLVHLLKKEQGSVLIFTRTRMGADRLAKFLAWGNIECTVIHGDRTQSERNQALRGLQRW